MREVVSASRQRGMGHGPGPVAVEIWPGRQGLPSRPALRSLHTLLGCPPVVARVELGLGDL